MRARVLAQNLAQRPWIWHLGEPGRPAFENSQSQLAGQARQGVNCNLWPLLLWPTSVPVGKHNNRQHASPHHEVATDVKQMPIRPIIIIIIIYNSVHKSRQFLHYGFLCMQIDTAQQDHAF